MSDDALKLHFRSSNPFLVAPMSMAPWRRCPKLNQTEIAGDRSLLNQSTAERQQ